MSFLFQKELTDSYIFLMNKQSDIYGLTDRDIKTILSVFNQYTEVLLVHIFGSRAKGAAKAGSDVDLAIMNKGVDSKTLLKLNNDFEESTLPYKVDLVNFHTLTNPDFIDHIRRVGVFFYQRDDDNRNTTL